MSLAISSQIPCIKAREDLPSDAVSEIASYSDSQDLPSIGYVSKSFFKGVSQHCRAYGRLLGVLEIDGRLFLNALAESDLLRVVFGRRRCVVDGYDFYQNNIPSLLKRFSGLKFKLALRPNEVGTFNQVAAGIPSTQSLYSIQSSIQCIDSKILNRLELTEIDFIVNKSHETLFKGKDFSMVRIHPNSTSKIIQFLQQAKSVTKLINLKEFSSAIDLHNIPGLEEVESEATFVLTAHVYGVSKLKVTTDFPFEFFPDVEHLEFIRLVDLNWLNHFLDCQFEKLHTLSFHFSLSDFELEQLGEIVINLRILPPQ